LDSDDFNRANSDAVGDKWIEVSGDFDISSNTLVCVTPGVLACTKCHPSAYPLGSFRASFDLINPSDGKVYKIRAGNPSSSSREVHWTVNGTGAGRTLTVEVFGDDAIDPATEVFPYAEGWHSDVVEVIVCYAPGLQLTALNNIEITRVTSTIDETGADNCHAGKGNFAFLEGDFDNWVYDVHWLENRDCNYCDCFCFRPGASPEDLFGLPVELTATLTDQRQCTLIAGTYTLYQRKSNMSYELNGQILEDPWVEKNEWWSDCIEPNASCGFRIGVFCTLDFESSTLMWSAGLYSCIEGVAGGLQWKGGTSPPWSAFPPYGSNWRYCVGGTSTCDPFYLEFPDLESILELCCEGDGDYYNEAPYVSLEVTV
jgi:hypothetical protein